MLKKEFAPIGANSFLLDPLLERFCPIGKQDGCHTCNYMLLSIRMAKKNICLQVYGNSFL